MNTNRFTKHKIAFEPWHVKTNNLGFRPGPKQTRMYSHRSRLQIKKEETLYYLYDGEKIKELSSFPVITKLICAFVFLVCRLSVFS